MVFDSKLYSVTLLKLALNAHVSGTHIVKSAELGGMIQGSVVANKCTVEKSFESIEEYEVCLNGAYNGYRGG